LLVELQDEFMKGAVEHSKVDEEFAKKIWEEWVVPLSGYAFNKSHALLYSMTSLHTAYLKAVYPAEFMTANLISETKSNAPQAKDNILRWRYALRSKGVKIQPPDINLSFTKYRLVSQDKLLTGLLALDGVKEKAAEEIIAKRPFKDFEDFLMRAKVNVKVVEALAACGALDSFGYSRKSMFQYAQDLRKKLVNWSKRKTTKGKSFEFTLPKEEWTKGELRAMEIEFIGEALSGRKVDSFPTLFANRGVVKVDKMHHMADKNHVGFEVEITNLFIFRVKNKDSKIHNQEVGRFIGEDIEGDQIGLVMFPEALAKFRELFFREFGDNAKMEKGFGIRANGSLSRYNGELSITVNEIFFLAKPVPKPKDRERRALGLYDDTPKKQLEKKTVDDLTEDFLDLTFDDPEEE
jgi:DNA polymerase-3 subunit alpha